MENENKINVDTDLIKETSYLATCIHSDMESIKNVLNRVIQYIEKMPYEYEFDVMVAEYELSVENGDKNDNFEDHYLLAEDIRKIFPLLQKLHKEIAIGEYKELTTINKKNADEVCESLDYLSKTFREDAWGEEIEEYKKWDKYMDSFKRIDDLREFYENLEKKYDYQQNYILKDELKETQKVFLDAQNITAQVRAELADNPQTRKEKEIYENYKKYKENLPQTDEHGFDFDVFGALKNYMNNSFQHEWQVKAIQKHGKFLDQAIAKSVLKDRLAKKALEKEKALGNEEESVKEQVETQSKGRRR